MTLPTNQKAWNRLKQFMEWQGLSEEQLYQQVTLQCSRLFGRMLKARDAQIKVLNDLICQKDDQIIRLQRDIVNDDPSFSAN
jgi:hypothetical protein